MSVNVLPIGPQPHPFHIRICEFLKRNEPALWNWFAADRVRTEQAETLRLELLKTTYRVDRDHQPEVYNVAADVASALGVVAPITIYQEQNSPGLNASLAYLPGEVHVVLRGPLREQLNSQELRALLGHELTHFHLWEQQGGELRVADQILAACSRDSQSHPAFSESWRLARLYTEIVCDRGGFQVVGDHLAVISTLLKLETGTSDVHPESYLRQAEEILSREQEGTEGVTHPESFIRARAIQLWAIQDSDVEALTSRMIEGEPGLLQLDLLRQEQVANATCRLIDGLLEPKWFQTPAAVAHARRYFEGYSSAKSASPSIDTSIEPQFLQKSLVDYFSFVLLDFVTIDPDLEFVPLAAALEMADRLGFGERFRELARTELKLGKKQLQGVDRDKQSLVQRAGVEHAKRPAGEGG
ncbi:MAG: M48 family metalloprotease, partial [Planctomycetota bacterium]|nr:M48 family metalloprotease [Planctomycetota bacterium]